MTTLADLRLTVRRNVADFPKVVVDTIPSYDGTTNPINTGKDLPIETQSETITVNNALQTRGVDYTIDYDARQTTWLNVPGAGASLVMRYKECVYKTEQIDDAISEGQMILFPTLYQRGVATITIRNLVRDYDLATADVNETAMRTVFSRYGHLGFRRLRSSYLPQGNTDQAYVPFTRMWFEGETKLHLWEMRDAGDLLRLEFAYAFAPLVLATDVTDVPAPAIPLVTEWATSVITLKQEPIRGRIDTANVLQGQFANPPGTMMQTSEDFRFRVEQIRRLLNIEAILVEPLDMPHRWEVGISR